MEPVTLDAAATTSESEIQRIVADAGINLRDCYQCGKCSAGCPVASEADMSPRQVIRNLQLGCIDPVMKSTMPWLCVGCGVCLARCPQDVDMPSLNEAICRHGMKTNRVAHREGERFMNIFLDNVENTGVSDEALLAARFNMEMGHFMQDVVNAPKMMQLGMLTGDGYAPSRDAEIARIVAKCRAEQQPDAADQKETSERRETASRDRVTARKVSIEGARKQVVDAARAVRSVVTSAAENPQAAAQLSAAGLGIAADAAKLAVSKAQHAIGKITGGESK